MEDADYLEGSAAEWGNEADGGAVSGCPAAGPGRPVRGALAPAPPPERSALPGHAVSHGGPWGLRAGQPRLGSGRGQKRGGGRGSRPGPALRRGPELGPVGEGENNGEWRLPGSLAVGSRGAWLSAGKTSRNRGVEGESGRGLADWAVLAIARR